MTDQRFWLALDLPDPQWREVTKEQFVQAERSAGFRNMNGQPKEPATAGFSGGGVQGTTSDPNASEAKDHGPYAKDPWDRTHRSTVPDGYND